MKKLWLAIAVLIALSGSVFADTLSITSNGSFSNLPTGAAILSAQGTTGTYFWNNNSTDGPGGVGKINVGDVLTNSGTLGATNAIGGEIAAASYVGAGDSDPSSFSFVRDTAAYQVSLLFAASMMNDQGPTNSTAIGIVDTTTNTQYQLFSNTQSTLSPVIGPTGVEAFPNISNGDSYIYYAKVCYEQPGGPTLCNMYYSNASLNSGLATSGLALPSGAAWNHFALFQLANNQGFVIALEDENSTTFGEGIGDFNDLVIAITAIPEPSTIGIMGLGLAGLAFLGRRRFAKN